MILISITYDTYSMNDDLDMMKNNALTDLGGWIGNGVQSISQIGDNIIQDDSLDLQSDSEGEQNVSGSTAKVDSDDDMLANIQAMGMQLGEDLEHPKELDLAGDINKAEEYIRTH